MKRSVYVKKIEGNIDEAVLNVVKSAGFLDYLTKSSRVAIKPNFTYPYFKPGVTTSVQVLRAAVRIFREYTRHIAIVEADGGYGAWKAHEAYEGHGIYSLSAEYGVEIVNLNEEPSETISFRSGSKNYQLPLPTRLLHETDLFITMPVPKIHCMTGLSLSYKNQWGCVPDIMRLRRHHIFDDAIVAINKALKPVVLADGIFFLDQNGPMDGTPIRMNLIIAATDAGAFDRYVSELMGFPWRRIPHLRRAAELADMPENLEDIECNISPDEARTHLFSLKRTLRNYIALFGFKSRMVTWLGYESWFGKVILHGILYAIVGKPERPRVNSASLESKKG